MKKIILKHIFAIMAVALTMCPPTSGNLIQGLPVIWTKSDTVLKSEDIIETLVFQYGTPCKAFFISGIDKDSAEELETWCESEIQSRILQPLEEFCRTEIPAAPPPSSTPTFKVAGGIWNCILGLAAEKMDATHDPELSSAAEQMTRETDAEKQSNLTQLLEQAIKSRQILTPAKVAALTSQMKASFTETMTLSLKLAAYIELTASHLNTFGDDWIGGKFSLKLFEVFSVKLTAREMGQYATAKPLQCYLSRREGIFYIQLRKAATDFHIQILEADPFTFYELEKGKDFGYKLEYMGPPTVAYDPDGDCVFPYSPQKSSVLFLPTPATCMSLNDKSVYKFWHKRCEPLYYLDGSVIQVKQIGHNYSIYCHGFNITVYRTKYPCPNHVITLHSNETFTIDSYDFRSKPIFRSDFTEAGFFVSNKVSFHLMPKLLNLTLKEFPISNECPKAPFPFFIVLGVFGGVLLLVVIGLVGVVVYLVRKSKDDKNQGVVVNIMRNLSVRVTNGRGQRPKVRGRKVGQVDYQKPDRNSLYHIQKGKVAELTRQFEGESDSEEEAGIPLQPI